MHLSLSHIWNIKVNHFPLVKKMLPCVTKTPLLFCKSRCCEEPVQRRNAVDSFQAVPSWHHVEAVAAVTWHMEVVFRVSVLHHDNEPRPSVGQIVAGHPLSALRTFLKILQWKQWHYAENALAGAIIKAEVKAAEALMIPSEALWPHEHDYFWSQTR